MKKKKLKKMINELKKKSERELDVEVNILTNKINSLTTSDRILEEKIKLIDERTMAMDNVKVQKTLDKTKELDDKIKILMDRTRVHYDAYSDAGVTFENCHQIIKCMADRGATKEELDNAKNYFNKYIFRCKMFKIYKADPETEENNDGGSETG